MNKFLLLICFICAVSVTLSYGQATDVLGNASSYAVLASSQINNSGASGITGNVGVSPGSTINGEAGLVVKNGKIEKNTASAISAHQDALVAYNALYARTPATPLHNDLGNSLLPLGPGVYKITGDASFKGVVTLTGNGDVNAKFVFIVDGDLLTDAPAAGVLAMNGAQPSNIYWVVTGGVNLGGSTGFQGTILSQGDITLGNGVVVIGRVQSINGQINLNNNNIFLPNVVVTDLKVSKAAAEGTYVVGSEVTYTITATNNGPGTATDVIVRENVPAGLEFVRVESSSKGTYNEATHIWEVGTLENGESATLKLVFKVVATGELKNSVTIIGRDPDPNPGDNIGEDPIDVPEPSANLSVTKSASAGPHKLGSEVTYTIVATNNGPYAATNVEVTEQLPAGLQYTSHQTTKGTFDPVTGKYIIGTLANGESATLTVVARIVAAGTIKNIAAVTSPDLPDPEPGDNDDEEPINVTCDDPGLTITGNGTVCAGQELTLTITEVTGGTYNYTLPAGFTEVARTATTITIKAGNTGGELTVNVVDLCGTAYTTAKTIVVTPAVEKPTIAGTAAACANADGLTYTITNAVEGVTYEWIVTGDVTITATTATSATINAGATGGTIAVKASNSCFNSTSDALTIGITPAPAQPAFVASASEVCAGKNATYEVAEVAGATGYTWTLPEGWTITSGEGTNKITVKAGTAGGNISVTADNACGSSAVTTIAVTANNVPALPTISGTTSGCTGSTVTYSVAEVTGATNYNWTVPQGWTIVSGENTPTIEVLVGQGAGNVTASVTNGCGDSETATIAVAPIVLTADLAIEGPDNTCAGSNDNTYTVTAQENATYQWTLPQGWTIVSGDGTNTITVAAGTSSGEVSVTVSTPCHDTRTVSYNTTVTTPPASAGTITDNSTYCDGLAFSIAAVPGATGYTWSVPAGCTIISGQGTTAIKVKADNPNVSGDIKVVAVTGSCTSPEAVLALDMSKVNGNLNFPKAFSPNGDGKNDNWVIANLEKYSGNEVMIYNRYGTEVYKKKNYQNDWTGNGLEQGTYFYKVLVKLCDGKDQVFTGYVTIFR
ncbi:DUF3494 domain-containing protein [Pontibacter sp. Tf4]|uniref:ice-binding family protein n=1 Tax=Pontibacter sp. Tf4 TaxID=2761620 RepID=UPI0016273440|nr:ice-binding family protein [Pontibacter sp. Tf4]MBB6613108.1 DUF3494 domain-containing protein [Pontibacter sp. Tf4]